MEVDDNELTSLTWLHSINILPQRSNKTSNKRRNDVSSTHLSKKSSEKKNTSGHEISQNVGYPNGSNINEKLSLRPAQILDAGHKKNSSQPNNSCNNLENLHSVTDTNDSCLKEANVKTYCISRQVKPTSHPSCSKLSEGHGIVKVDFKIKYKN